jgi:hypothetical protein
MRNTSIIAELRKARKLIKSEYVTSIRIDRLPPVARAYVLHYVTDNWVFSPDFDCWSPFKRTITLVDWGMFPGPLAYPAGAAVMVQEAPLSEVFLFQGSAYIKTPEGKMAVSKLSGTE